LNKDEEEKNLYQVALRLLHYRPRTEGEMEQLLLRRNFSAEKISKIIKKLKDYNYLDDNKYAYERCRYLAEIKLLGPIQIRSKLKIKGLNDNLISSVLNDYFKEHEETCFLQKAIDKKIKKDGKPQTIKEFKRLFDYVKRRGFSLHLIWQQLEETKQAIERKAKDKQA
jgi:regulatory protein